MPPADADPAAMRASAAQLRYRAEQIADVARRADTGVAAATYAGPAAVRWRGEMADRSSQLRSLAARMQAVAENLARQATVAEVEILQRQLELRAQEAGGHH